MKKLLHLVNDERKISEIKSTKACTTLDHANCGPATLQALDYCTYVDVAGCYGISSNDTCDYDYAACGGYNQGDFCVKDFN